MLASQQQERNRPPFIRLRAAGATLFFTREETAGKGIELGHTEEETGGKIDTTHHNTADSQSGETRKEAPLQEAGKEELAGLPTNNT